MHCTNTVIKPLFLPLILIPDLSLLNCTSSHADLALRACAFWRCPATLSSALYTLLAVDGLPFAAIFPLVGEVVGNKGIHRCLLVGVGVLCTSGRDGTRSRPFRIGRPLITVAASFDVRHLTSCRCHGTTLMMRLVFFAHFFPNEFKYFVGRHAARNLLQVESVAVHRKFVQALNEVPLTFGVNRRDKLWNTASAVTFFRTHSLIFR